MMKPLFLIALLAGLLASAAYTQTKSSAPAKDPGLTGFSGTVLETTNVANYTYARVDTGKEKLWVAAPRMELKVGEKVTVPEGMPMKDFQSRTLNRTFDTIYFVGSIDTPSHPAQTATGDPHAGLGQKMAQDPHAGMPKMTASKPSAPLTFFGITTPKGGLTIADIYAKKNALANKKVLIRGKVAKYNEVMNRNWIHLQDGTGSRGANDLTITTSDTAAPGDTVLVEGVLALNKDFGYGYKYDLIVENAKVTVEKKAKP